MRTRRSKAGTVTPFANPERQFRARREVLPAPIHNIYTFYESESSESDTENESTLIQVIPLTLEGIAKRWFERTSTDCTKSWNDLKQNFIRRFCPPSMIFQQLSEIRNFKQEEGESLFDTWERYNELLFKCHFHDLNDHQKVNTFYNGLNSQTRCNVDSNGVIPGLTASDALKSIQKLVEHSHKWHCEDDHVTTLNPLCVITEKLKLLNHEIEEVMVDFRKMNTDNARKKILC
ncbi:hypothetical protein Tco_1265641 [Tanacetum coccineum]